MPHHSLFHAAARCWEHAGHFDHAAERFALADAWNDAGRCWAQAGRFVDAAGAYARAGEPIGEARQWLASPWPERARRPYLQALERRLSAAAEVEALLGLGEIELASERAFAVASENGCSVDALRSLARIAAARGRPDLAARAWDQVLAGSPAVAREVFEDWEAAASWNRSLGWGRPQAGAAGWPSREFRDVRLELVWEEKIHHMGYGNRALAWSADGRRFAATKFNEALILGGLVGREVRLRAVEMRAISVALNPESDSVLVGCNGGKVVRVDASGNIEDLEELRMPDQAWAVAFSPRGDRLVCVSGAILRIWFWGPEGPREMLREEQPREDEGANPSVAWSSDGKTLAWCPGPFSEEAAANNLYLFTETNTQFIHAAHENGVNGIAFSPDGSHLVTVSLDRTLSCRDAQTGEAVAPPWSFAQKLLTAAFHPQTLLIAAGGTEDISEGVELPGRLYLCRFSQTEQLEVFQERVTETAVTALAFSPDGDHLLMSTYDRLSLFRVHLL